MGDICTAGACVGGTDTCLCNSDTECVGQDDGDLCNGVLFCNKAAKKCEFNPATVVNCPSVDDTQCQKNLCQPKTGKCALTATAEGKPCDDGNACTPNEACAGGACKASQNVCQCQSNADCAKAEDGNLCNGTLYCNNKVFPYKCEVNQTTVVVCPNVDDTSCTKATCQPKTGTCAPVALPDTATCDADGNPCTPIDHCKQGACQADANVCQCQTTADCAAKEDADLCNGKLYCDKTKNVCKVNPATVVLCGASFDTPCIENRCDKATAKCSLVAINDNGACDADGNPCTVADTCTAGKCIAAANTCECTADADCAAKEDGNPCNGTLYCDKTVFKCAVNAKTVLSCPSVNDKPCSRNLCNPKTALCEMTSVLQGKPCDADGNTCTLYDTCDQGACKLATNLCDCEFDGHCGELEDGKLCNGTLYCDKGTALHKCQVSGKSVVACPLPADGTCTLSACDEKAGGCVAQPYNEGKECADGNLCTTGDVCKAGACGGVTTVCDDKNPCTLDNCEAASGKCAFKAKVCQDGNECTQDSCDVKGECSFAALGNATPCTKADACTASAACFGDVCKSVPNTCDDKDACTKDSCDPLKGCLHQPATGPCDDLDACTSNDQCDGGGKCSGKAKCDDGDLCTADSCDATTAACSATPKVCNDDNPCTADTCNKGTGLCGYAPTTASCDDGNACTVSDACAGGSCTGKAKCDDGNACTVDSCSGSGGSCVNTAKNCNDSNACTVDACNAANGTCSNTADDAIKPGGTCSLPGGECALVAPACSGGKVVCSNGGADPNKEGAVCKSGGGICQAGGCNSRPAVVSALFVGPYKAGDGATLTIVVADGDNDAAKPTSDTASLTVDLTAVGGDAKAKPTQVATAGTQQTWTLAVATAGLPAGAHLLPVTLTDKVGAVAVGHAVLLIHTGSVHAVGADQVHKTVKSAMDAAVSGDTVVLSPGTYSGTGNKNLSVPSGKHLHIIAPEGPDKVVIDCATAGRFLQVSDTGKLGQLVLSGVTIKNCGAGAVRVVSTTAPAELTLHNVKLLNNKNGDHGGGVHVAGAQASVQVIGSLIQGGDLTGFGGGGLFVSKGTLTVLGSTLADNKSIYNGGPDSGRGGGILSLDGKVAVRDSVLSGNFAQGYKGHASAATGGSFELTRTLVTDSEEAVFLLNVTTVVLDQLTVIGGSAQTSVLNNDGTTLVKDCTFAGGSMATNFTGSGKLTLTNSKWLDIKGQALSVGAMPTVASGLLIRNANGAAMDNRAVVFSCGFSGTPVSIKNSVFRNNTGKSYGAFNGVGCTFDMDSCTFDGNSTGDLGGGAYLMAVGAVRNTVFVNNQTGGGGGGLIVAPNPMFSNPMELHNVLLVNNKAGSLGGGLLVIPQNAGTTQPVVLRGLTATGNTAKFGGGIAIQDSDATLDYSILFGNTDTEAGGNSGDQFWAAATANTKPVVQWTLCNGDEGQFGDPGLKVNGGNGYFAGSDGNLDGDPLFVTGPKGGWYLSQSAAGQAKNSPAVDPKGGAAASGFAWGARTTRTDGVADGGALDLGWHW